MSKESATIYQTCNYRRYIDISHDLSTAIARSTHHAWEIGNRAEQKADRFTRVRLFLTTLRRELQTIYDGYNRSIICDIRNWYDAGKLEDIDNLHLPKYRGLPKPSIKITLQELKDATMIANILPFEDEQKETKELLGELKDNLGIEQGLLKKLTMLSEKSTSSVDKINDLCQRILEM